MAEEVEEIMARAIEPLAFDERTAVPFEHGRQAAKHRARQRSRRIIAALRAHGYEIRKKGSDMLSIPEVSTDRPIGR